MAEKAEIRSASIPLNLIATQTFLSMWYKFAISRGNRVMFEPQIIKAY